MGDGVATGHLARGFGRGGGIKQINFDRPQARMGDGGRLAVERDDTHALRQQPRYDRRADTAAAAVTSAVFLSGIFCLPVADQPALRFFMARVSTQPPLSSSRCASALSSPRWIFCVDVRGSASRKATWPGAL